MGLKRSWLRSPARIAAMAVPGVLVLAGCGPTLETAFGLPPSASDRAVDIANLWVGSWIAALAIGVLMWALMFWAVIRYRRRRDDEVPRQTRYHLPLELLYTLVPILIIGVLFYFTVLTQNRVHAESKKPDHVIDVVGQKWSWTFNYREAKNPAVGADVWEAGTIEKTPTLVLPVGQTVRFNLHSPDVIHSFWIPAFHYKLDIIPGRNNSFEVTPTKTGTFAGKCAELCGTYHSAMIFNVQVVTPEKYAEYLKGLERAGQKGARLGPTPEVKKPPVAHNEGKEGNR